MLPMVTITIDIGLRAVLFEMSREIEIARAPRGGWFGAFTMQPLSISDLGVRVLRAWGLLEVTEWDEGPERCRLAPDPDRPWHARRVRTRTKATRARLSTDGWVFLDR